MRHLLHPSSPFQITFVIKIPIPALPKKLPQSTNPHVKLAMTSGIGPPTHSATYKVAEVEIKRPHPFCSEVPVPKVLQPLGKCHGRRELCLAEFPHIEDTRGKSLSLTLHNSTLHSLQEFPYLMTARWKSTPLLPALKTSPLLLPLLLLIYFPSAEEPADEGSVPCLVLQVMETWLLSSAPFLLRFSGFVFPEFQGKLSPS